MFIFIVSLSGCSSEKQRKDSIEKAKKEAIKNFEEYGVLKVKGLEEEHVAFEKVDLPDTHDRHTSLTFGPDGKLYASTIDGRIKRFTIHEDGTIVDKEIIYSLQDANSVRTPRLTIGFEFDPSSDPENLIAYVTHSTFVLTDGPAWDGKLSRLSGENLQHVEDVLINLPRSAKDHLTNSIVFGPDSALYFTQGSNTAMGDPDKTWSFREESLLSAAVLRLDFEKLASESLPLDVKTEEGGTYNPFAHRAPLTIYATGLRNSYDLLWHSNNNLYIPTNGSSAGGNVPTVKKGVKRINGEPYNGPFVRGIQMVKQPQKDFMFRVEKGGYYGHPNPGRGEFILNGGNPSFEEDPAEVEEYPVGILPDANWRGYSFDFHHHISPNGIIEYQSSAFNGALKGKILVTTFANNKGIVVLEPGGEKNDIIAATEGNFVPGFSNFKAPLDLVEDINNGNIYVSEFGDEGKITLLRPTKGKDPSLAER